MPNAQPTATVDDLVARIDAGDDVTPEELARAEAQTKLSALVSGSEQRRATAAAEQRRLDEIAGVVATIQGELALIELEGIQHAYADAVQALTTLKQLGSEYEGKMRAARSRLRQLQAGAIAELDIDPGQLGSDTFRIDGRTWSVRRQLGTHLVADAALEADGAVRNVTDSRTSTLSRVSSQVTYLRERHGSAVDDGPEAA